MDELGPSFELLVKQQLTESEPRLMSAKGVGGESFCWAPEPEVWVLRGSEPPGIGETPDRLPGQRRVKCAITRTRQNKG